MTDIDTLIAEVLKLDGEATPGPWAAQVIHHGYHHIPCGPPFEGPDTDPRGIAATDHNARLIATYRTAAPLLAAEVQRLRAELDAARADAAELRLSRAAERCRPEGGADLGFTFDGAGWQYRDAAHAATVSTCHVHPVDDPYYVEVWRLDGSIRLPAVFGAYATTAREAMRLARAAMLAAAALTPPQDPR